MKKIEMKYIVGGLIALGVLFWGVSWYVAEQQSAYVAATRLLIANQETTLAGLAELIDRNGVDEVTASLVRDCAVENRARFDELLSRLDTLNKSEQLEVDKLFDACGDFYAQRKAVMVARFEREFEVYDDYVQLLKLTDKRVDLAQYPVDRWQELVLMEQERSELAAEIVRIQGEIISALLAGESVRSDEMLMKTAKASEARDSFAVTGVRVDELRTKLLDL